MWFLSDMKRILVTGATGKVGSHFINRVLESDDFQDVSRKHGWRLSREAFRIAAWYAPPCRELRTFCIALPARKLRMR
jgi:hypothetical protein